MGREQRQDRPDARGRFDARGAPYRIRRIDGQSWIVEGHPYDSGSIWAAPRYLRPLPDLDQEGWTDWEAIQQLQMQRALQRSLRGEK